MTTFKVTKKWLEAEIQKYSLYSQYPIPKYVLFVQVMHQHNIAVNLYIAKKSESKYLYVRRGKNQMKLRFSAHKTYNARDIDIQVGRGGTNTYLAAKQVLENFNVTANEDVLRTLK